MKTKIFLIRHGTIDALGSWLAGRMSGVHLNQRGQTEAQQLVRRFAEVNLQAIYSSPLERAQETAQPLGQSKGLDLVVREEFNEIDFGQWTGKSFSELDKLPLWRQFNSCRGTTRIPGGETMLDVVHRMASGIEALQKLHEGHRIAVFSHADSIRAALTYYIGTNLDCLHRFEIEPASISILELDLCEPRILTVNDRCDGLMREM